MTHETIEEAAAKFYPPTTTDLICSPKLVRDAFIEGAKWKAERNYFEVVEFAEWIRVKDFQTATIDRWIGLDMEYYTTQELFEQFKKQTTL